jgi:hypothetical protein
MEPQTEFASQSIVLPLPRQKRRRLFLMMLAVFIVAVPAFVFYAAGYRYSIFDNESGVISTGGMYIAMSQNNGEIYLDEEVARGSRIFRRATYIQSVSPGIHRVHVQGEGLQTWVKNLPVFPHMVTEAEAILLPVRPVARLITASSTNRTTAVLSAEEFELMETITPLVAVTTNFIEAGSSTSPVTDNLEYTVLRSRFIADQDLLKATTSTSTPTDVPAFRFSSETAEALTTPLERIVTRGDMRLFMRDTSLFAQYVGSARSIPHYFCVPTTAIASTTELYGAHVAYGIEAGRSIQTSFQTVVTEAAPNETRVCRNEIRLDNKFQEIRNYQFLPTSSDYVIMHRSDGVFVVEVDDRSWQNVQPLFPYPVDAMLVDNGRIYVQLGTLFIELFTVLPNN